MSHTGGLYNFDAREIFTFLFIMLGPVKLLAPFAKLTATSDKGERRSLALRGTLIATLTVLAASFIGQAMLVKWSVSPGALAIAGGILFSSSRSLWFSIHTRSMLRHKAPLRHPFRCALWFGSSSRES